MSTHHEPSRWLDADTTTDDALTSALKAGLRQAGTQGPNAQERRQLRAALGLPIAEAGTQTAQPTHQEGAPASVGATQSPSRATTVSARLRSGLLWKLGIAVLGGAALWWALQPSAPSRRSASHDRHTTEASETAAASPVDSESATASHAASEPPTEAEPDDISAHTAPAPRPPAKSEKRASSKPTPESPSEDSATRAPSRQAQQARPTDGPQEAAPDPFAELRLLKRARAHARSAPRRALALVEEHETRFANGSFVQEREVIAVDALLAAGERREAMTRAERFLERFPESAHVRRVRALLNP